VTDNFIALYNSGLSAEITSTARKVLGPMLDNVSDKSRPLREPVLPDDYPIYAGYVYVADGVPIVSDWHDITAREFKMREGITELRRCDLSGRGLV
jgi:hypothetical protein